MNTNTQVLSAVNTIVTHRRPHIDEIVAIVLLRAYGEKKFPGIKNATLAFWDAGSANTDNKSWKQHHREGRVLIGVGGSCFDEHPSATNDRKDGHCAATLVAQYLGISDLPELEQLLRYTLNNDTKGGNNPFDLAALTNLMNKTWFDTNPQGAVNWAIQAVEMLLQKQVKFFRQTAKEFNEYAEVIKCDHKGKNITVVAIQSNDEDMGAYARSDYGASAAIVIQQNQKGQVSITSQKRAKIDFSKAIVVIRRKEAYLKKIDFSKMNLTIEGTIPEISEWYYDEPAARILNGSLTAPNVAATQIPFGELIGMIIKALSTT